MSAALDLNAQRGTALPEARPHPPRIAILVLNYNRIEDTVACLESILKSSPQQCELIVIDNASSDGSVQKLRRWVETKKTPLELVPAIGETNTASRDSGPCRLTILQMLTNLGFAGGNNVGIQYALTTGASWILLLNNDTIVEPDALSALIEGAERSGADLAGCRIYEYDSPSTPWYLGGIFNWWGDRTVTSPLPSGVQESIAVETDWITGCCLLVRREVFETVGLLDQQSFLYYEDVDFCRRAANAGFKRFVVAGAKIYHKVSRSAVLGSALSRYHATRSRLYFHRKSHSRISHTCFVIVFVLSRILRSLVWILSGRQDLVRASWAAFRDYWRLCEKRTLYNQR